MSDEAPAPANPNESAPSGGGFGIYVFLALVLVVGALVFVVFGLGTSSLLPANYNGFDH